MPLSNFLDISYTYKGRLARDFGGIFEYFWEKIELIVANPIELCQTTPVANKKQIKGRFPRTESGHMVRF